MEKGTAADRAEATGMTAAADGPTGLATVAPPPSGQKSIADQQGRARPARAPGGAPSGSITPEEGLATGGTLAKDKDGGWSYTTPDGETLHWDASAGLWRDATGARVSAASPEDVARIASGTLDEYSALLDIEPGDAPGRRS